MNTMMQLQLLLGTGAAPEGGLARKSSPTANVSFQAILGEQRSAQVTVQELAALGDRLQGPDREVLNDLLVRLEGADREKGSGDVLAQLGGDGESDQLPADLALLNSLHNQMAWQAGIRQQQSGQPATDGRSGVEGSTGMAAAESVLMNGTETIQPLPDEQTTVIETMAMAGNNAWSQTVQTGGDAARMSAAAEAVRPVTQRNADSTAARTPSSTVLPVTETDIDGLPVDARAIDSRPGQELRFQHLAIQAQPASPVIEGRGEAPPTSATGLFDDQLGALNGTARHSPQAADASTMTANRQDFTQAALQAKLGTPQWGPELGRQMATLVQRGDQRVSLHLNPQELGPLSVDIRVHEQQAQLQIMSSHAQVRSAVEQALPQLREALAEQGINLADTSVSDQRPESREGRDGGGSGLAGSEGNVQPIEAEADTESVATITDDGSGINLYV